MSGLSKSIGRVSVLLDYYPSAQFAGLHVANRLGLFRKKGLELNLLPPPGAGGDEPQLVCDLQRAFDKQSGGFAAETPQLAVGTVEQVHPAQPSGNVLGLQLDRGARSACCMLKRGVRVHCVRCCAARRKVGAARNV